MFQTELAAGETIRKSIQCCTTNRFQTELSAVKTIRKPIQRRATNRYQTELAASEAAASLRFRPLKGKARFLQEQAETSTKKESNTTHIRSPRNQEKTGNLTGITKSFHSVRLPYTEKQTGTSKKKASSTTYIRPPRSQEKTETPPQTSMRKHASLPIAKLKAELFPNTMLLRSFFFRMRNRKTDEPDGMLFIVDGFEQLLCQR